MPNIDGIIKSLQNIMWKDPGVSGDAQRLEQLGRMITLKIIDDKLFPGLQNLDVSTGNKRAVLIRDIFAGTNNYMKNGTIIRQVVNKLNEIDFNASEDVACSAIFTKAFCVICRAPVTRESSILRVLLQKL